MVNLTYFLNIFLFDKMKTKKSKTIKKNKYTKKKPKSKRGKRLWTPAKNQIIKLLELMYSTKVFMSNLKQLPKKIWENYLTSLNNQSLDILDQSLKDIYQIGYDMKNELNRLLNDLKKEPSNDKKWQMLIKWLELFSKTI